MADCPAGLQRIVTRALRKNRDARCPEMRSLRVDLDGVRRELERGRIVAMVAEARARAGENKLDEAAKLLEDALELEPVNAEARTLKRDVERRIVRPQVESIVAEAEEFVRTRRFGEAAVRFEKAIRLDLDDATPLARTVEVRELRDRKEKADVEAMLEFGTNPDVALTKLDAALELDAGNQQALLRRDVLRSQREKELVERRRADGFN